LGLSLPTDWFLCIIIIEIVKVQPERKVPSLVHFMIIITMRSTLPPAVGVRVILTLA
jgi:hypothetical protein